MIPNEDNNRRGFIKISVFALAGLSLIPYFGFGENNGSEPVFTDSGSEGASVGLKTVAFITNSYRNSTHADAIGTKLFIGIPTDEGMVKPQVRIVSMWIDQIGSNDPEAGNGQDQLDYRGASMIGTIDTCVRIGKMNGAVLYPTIAEALCLGGDKLAVDAVVFIGEHGDYMHNRLGEKMYPRMNYLEQIFKVFDASNRSVPVYSDKALSYSWLDSKWIYDRAKELNVPIMAGSSLPYCWRDTALVHPIGTKITEAVGIGYASLDAYGFHICEILQCMVERRAGGETGVASVESLKGKDVWEAIDSGKISLKLVNAACDKIKGKATGSMRDLVKNPLAVVVRYNDGTMGAILSLDEYVNQGWAYAAFANGKTVATEFVVDNSMSYAHFSCLTLNIQKFLVTGKPPCPIERNLLTTGMIDMGIRSLDEGKVKKTPFLDIVYNLVGYESIRPTRIQPIVQSLGIWPPKGYEFHSG